MGKLFERVAFFKDALRYGELGNHLATVGNEKDGVVSCVLTAFN